ncbi:restriction endonuclease subunit S [uncultured Marivita sp.]|uniref:restriction endonuclease subunit S n=1 Tax=uncultured Marivita sp. TaxID=888080 RepID=UPI00261120B0|nr:restriction endonuclease subunit S [uncultured Marivita sp.]
MKSPVPELRFPEFKGPWKPARAGDAFRNSKAKGEAGLPVYSVTQNRGMVRRDSLDRHMGADAADGSNLRAQPGDLVYNMMRMWQGAVGMASEECMVSPAYVVLSPRKGVSSKFFDYWFQNRHMLHQLWAYSHGLTNDRLRLYYQDFAKIPLALPDQPEQEKIAAVLDATSRKITLLTSKKTALEDYKRGLMQRLFSRELRFTRDDGSPFPAWEERKLSSLLKEHKQKSDGTEAVHSVSVVHGLIDQVAHLGRSYAAETTLHYNRVNPGDIVYTKSPTGKFPFGIIKQSQIAYSAIVSPLYGVFRPTTHQIGMFLDVYFSSESNTERFLRPLVNKGAKNTMNINNSTFLSGKVWVPVDPDEIQKIRDLFSSLDKKILCLSTEISDMEAYKKGLLQKLFV